MLVLQFAGPRPDKLTARRSMPFALPAPNKYFFILLGALVFTLSATKAVCQSSTPQVRISIKVPSEVEIQIDNLALASSWSFLNSYAGALGLGDRIESFEAARSGRTVPVTKLASGEFRSPASADMVRYVVRTSSHLDYMPFVSGLTDDSAVLLPADLLPESLVTNEVAIQFELPPGWRIESSLRPDAGNSFRVRDPERTVFLAGNDLRAQNRSVKGIQLRVVVSGQWGFSEKVVMDAASAVLQEYYSIVGFKLREPPVVFVSRLPLSQSSWKAETRGSTVSLLFKTGINLDNWKGNLGVIFTHEIFHLWVPNSLVLKGEYDWFFEGFTMYLALQVALKLKLINFAEYLNTLTRVYRSYLSSPEDRSLIDAASSRWTSSNSLVYDKGMLVAFIYDLTMRSSTQARTSITSLYPLLFNSADEPANGNDVIIRLLTSSPATLNFGRSYIESSDRIDLGKILPSFGFQVSNGNEAQISVRNDLTDEQKKLLHSLGYKL